MTPEDKRAAFCRYSKAWRERNPDKVKAQWAAYYAKHKERVKAQKQKHYRENRDTHLARGRNYRQQNPAYFAAKAAERRAQVYSATPKWVDKDALKRIYDSCPKGLHVDHIVPLCSPVVCGLHVPWNLQYLPAKVNQKKNNKLLEIHA